MIILGITINQFYLGLMAGIAIGILGYPAMTVLYLLFTEGAMAEAILGIKKAIGRFLRRE